MPIIRFPDPPWTDGTVALRAWRDEDVPAVVDACQDPEIPRWTRVPSPYTPELAREWFAGHEREVADERGLSLAIVDAGSDEVLGSIGLVDVDLEDAWAEVGYWVAGHVRRQGVATAGVRLLARWAFEELGFQRLQLLAATGNVGSQRVAERAGFTREGVLRSAIAGKDERHDAALYGLLPGEMDV